MKHLMITACVAVAGFAASASGHPTGGNASPGEPHRHAAAESVRVWTNTRTQEAVRGAFLAAREAGGVMLVSIERENGEVVSMPLADLAEADRDQASRRIAATRAVNTSAGVPGGVADAGRAQQPDAPAQATPFNMFAPNVRTRWDERWLYVESDGLPHKPGAAGTFDFSHTLMVGITAWQQQVPLPQNYRGANAWQIPLAPELAEKPVSAKEQLFKGAIALAANGVPIFNPIKNDGRTDTHLAGELDEFGGHCGRADDYHYHVAPTHLEKFVGKGRPIAYALDGFAIYGLFDPKAKAGEDRACPLGSHEPLDWLNGHFAAPAAGAAPGDKGLYHYHASTAYPYLNGGMRGKVTVREDQIEPQPRATPVRDWLQPLRGARIVGFEATGKPGEPAWTLRYTVGGRPGSVSYRIQGQGRDARYVFDFVAVDGKKTTATYAQAEGGRRGGGPGGGGGGGRGGGGRRGDGGRPGEPATAPSGPEASTPASTPGQPVEKPVDKPAEQPPGQQPSKAGFVLHSSDVVDGRLNVECTCDGAGRAPALAWTGVPANARSLAMVMHHVPPDGETHVYMVRVNLPADVRELKPEDQRVGVWGRNTVNRRAEYAPPCSQGPGDKAYTLTLYALSAEVKAEGPMAREALLAAIKDTTLGTASLEVKYARRADGGGGRGGKAPEGDRPGRGGRGGGGGGGGGGGKRYETTPQPAATPGGAEGQRPGLLARMSAFKTDFPAVEHSLVLASPTADSVLVSVRAAGDVVGRIEFGDRATGVSKRTAVQELKAGEPSVFRLDLGGGSGPVWYRWVWVAPADRALLEAGGNADSAKVQRSEVHTFHRPRSPGQRFAFTIQADSHLDQAVEPKVYEQTLANMLASKPDFLVDLGDTFMTDKRGADFTSALAQYDAQRYYFSRIAHSTPLFMVLGNHDGEKGSSGRNPEDIGPWSFRERTARFPAPVIDNRMYTGRTTLRDGRGSNHYAFQWGDALLVVLDPFWSTGERIRGGGGGGGGGAGGGREGGAGDDPLSPTDASWAMTLGKEQYDWLASTLKGSTAKYRFVFIHHLVGGLGGPEARGGAESARFFEWGGKNADGSDGFASRRPGWPMPIHDLLVANGVSAVFHGHDHLFVRSERDGVVYQCVPQPGNLAGNTRTAERYGYRSGTVLGSPGHVRVEVGPDAAAVQFVRTAVPGLEDNRNGRRRAGPAEANGEVVHEYQIKPAGAKSAAP
ncbi:MAG: YHYH protein [bacterium]